MYHTSMYIQLNFIYHCPVILLDSQHIQEMFPFIWQDCIYMEESMGHFEILTCLKGLAFGIKVFVEYCL